MSIMPIDPIFSKLLVTSTKSKYIQVQQEITAIVAMLSVENIYYNFTNLDS